MLSDIRKKSQPVRFTRTFLLSQLPGRITLQPRQSCRLRLFPGPIQKTLEDSFINPNMEIPERTFNVHQHKNIQQKMNKLDVKLKQTSSEPKWKRLLKKIRHKDDVTFNVERVQHEMFYSVWCHGNRQRPMREVLISGVAGDFLCRILLV